MPRYVVERRFPSGQGIAADGRCRAIVERNADAGVTWLHSYVSGDGSRSFCVYEAPTPEAVRKAATRNALPVERITQVLVLDPYFYA